MADGVDAAVELMQAPRIQPSFHFPLADAQASELLQSHHAVLALRQRGDLGVISHESAPSHPYRG